MELITIVFIVVSCIVSYKVGVLHGKKKIISALNIPEGCEIAGISFRPTQRARRQRETPAKNE